MKRRGRAREKRAAQLTAARFAHRPSWLRKRRARQQLCTTSAIGSFPSARHEAAQMQQFSQPPKAYYAIDPFELARITRLNYATRPSRIWHTRDASKSVSTWS